MNSNSWWNSFKHCKMFLVVITGVLVVMVLRTLYEHFMRKPYLSNISDKYVLVTGCDSGFGKGLALRLDRLGCHVLAGCLTQQGMEQLTEACSSRLKGFLLDVSKEESVKQALHFANQQLPEGVGLHGLVNNAGISDGECSPPVPEFYMREDFQKVLDVNLIGMADMTFTFLPLIKQAKGRIVNTSSLAGRIATTISNIPYTTSKYGVQALSDSTRIYLGQYGVKVSIIEPGPYGTQIVNPSNITQKLLKGFQRIPQKYRHLLVTEEEYEKRVQTALAPLGEMASSDITPVVDAYTHALFSVHPKKRYAVGGIARYFGIPLSYAPSCVQDWIARSTMKKYPIASPWKNI